MRNCAFDEDGFEILHYWIDNNIQMITFVSILKFCWFTLNSDLSVCLKTINNFKN